MKTDPKLILCTDCVDPLIFIRHHRALRAVRLGYQCWFSLQDMARLMGKALDERSTRKLDSDQHRHVWLHSHGEWQKCLMISDSGIYALLVHHYVPENRALRLWLSSEVIPMLRSELTPPARHITVVWWRRMLGLPPAREKFAA